MFKKALISILILLLVFNLYRMVFVKNDQHSNELLNASINKDTSAWVGPSHYQIPLATQKNGSLIQYGYELIAHTALYLGPKGTVQHSTNGK
jgi:thiosulfate dehydrogenase